MMVEEGLSSDLSEFDEIEVPSLISGVRRDPAAPEFEPKSWAERYANSRETPEERRAMWQEFDTSWVMVSELVAATLTWGGIGWLLDRWLGFEPVLMSIGFVIGFCSGFYLLWGRSVGRIARPSDAVQQRASSQAAADDPANPDPEGPHE